MSNPGYEFSNYPSKWFFGKSKLVITHHCIELCNVLVLEVEKRGKYISFASRKKGNIFIAISVEQLAESQ